MANEFARNRQDADVNPASKTLPAAASTAANSASIDLGTTSPKLGGMELEIGAPILTTTELPDTKTTTYSIEDSADDSSFATIQDAVLVQTGAGGTGAAAATARVGLGSATRQYIRLVGTTGAGTGDQSAKSMTLKAMF